MIVLIAPAPSAYAIAFGDNGDFVVSRGSIYGQGHRDMYRVGSDGSRPVNLTNGLGQDGGSWSPDGRRIAFTGNGSIVVTGPNGNGRRVVLAGDDHWIPSQLAWSPDGTEIAYARVTLGPDGRRESGEVHILDLATRRSRYVAPTGRVNTEIDWSPDGKQLVFQHWRPVVEGQRSAAQVMVVDRDGSNLRNLTLLTGGDAADWRPSWTHDGRIVFRRYGACVAPAQCASDFHLVNPDGTGLERLGLGRIDWTGDEQIDPAARLRLSPDGSMWAALIQRAGGDESSALELWTLDISSGRKAKVYSPVFWFFDWQPRCTVLGTRGDDVLRGTQGRDLICGLGGDDVIRGLGGKDSIFGHGGDDRILGGSGADIVVGNAGRDRCDQDESDHSRVC